MASLRRLPEPNCATPAARTGPPGCERPPTRRRGRPARSGHDERGSGSIPLRVLAIAAGVLVAGSAQAQVLIGNIGQWDNGHLNLKAASGAQRFTTGSHAAGYTLTSIEIRLDAGGSPRNHVVTLRSGSANGTTEVTFNNPTPALTANTRRNYTFTPASTVTLDPDTHYWVRIDKNTSSDLELRRTDTASYDGTPAARFSMSDKYELRISDSGSFSVSQLPSNHLRMLLRVNGSPVNALPTASSGTVATDQYTDYVFRGADFDFSDGDASDTLASVKVATLPSPGKGALKFDGGAIDSGDLPKTVTRTELEENKLVYAPPGNAFGNAFASFDFKVNDGKDDSATTYAMTIDVNKAIDRPMVANTIADRTAMVDTAFSFQLAENAFSSRKPAPLTYSATQYDGAALPSWLSFAPGTRIFSGTPQSGDAGRVAVKVTASDRDGRKASDSFDIVVSAKPSISGTARVGRTLTARTGSSDSFTYEWIRVDGMDESSISGASSSTYTLDAADLGKKVKVKVSFAAEGQPAERTSDAYPPHAPIQSATCGPAELAGHREVWAGTLTAGALVAGPRTELVGYGWSSATGDLSGLDDAIDLGANSYRIGRNVLLLAHSGDLTGLLRSPPGSLVFSLIGSGDSRDTDRATQELTAAQKAALRLHVCGRSFDFSDASLLHWGDYEWQAPDLVWAKGDTIPLKLSVPPSFMQAAVDPPAVEGAPALSGAGEDGVWSPGETVRVALTFSEAVEVDTGGGTPSVGIGLGGTAARSADYRSGGGTAELVFAYTLVEADGAHGMMGVTANGLALNGGTVRSKASRADAVLAHEGILASGRNARSAGPGVVFRDVPESHDGATAFRLGLRFSGEPAGLDPKRDAASVLEATGGRVTGARQTSAGANPAWEVTVAPDGLDAVTVRVPAQPCGETHAVCIGGRPLARAAEASVPGPPMLSVAEATVAETREATLRFVVTLSRALPEAVTVRYATADGTAMAGDDYTATSGTLTFAADETSQTVSVAVLNDTHDEGSETMTLTLSDPSPARVKLADAEATGTITNTDATPKAWIARFARTVADQVLDAVRGRMRAVRQAGAEVNVGGERIGLAAPSGTGAVRARAQAAPDRAPGQARDAEAGPGSGSGAGATRRARLADRGRSTGGRELLLGSSFSVAGETAGDGFVSVWGRGAMTRFDGREGALSLDGEVATAMLGTDWSQGPWSAGLVTSRSLGDGRYRGGSGRDAATGGTVESALTGLYAWLRRMLGGWLEGWGMAGYGAGELALKPVEAPAVRTDLHQWMAAAGLRGTLLNPGSGSRAGGAGGGLLDGLTLAGKTDALIVSTSTGSVSGTGGNLAAARARMTRLRLALEASRPLRLGPGSGSGAGGAGGGALLTPGLEVGLRHDGGDADTGFGVDLGGFLTLAGPARGIRAELRGRGLLSHAAKGFRQRGLSGSLSWEPAPDGRGPRLSLTQSIGGSTSGGADALFRRGTLAGLSANPGSGSGAGGTDLARRRLGVRFGYGFAAFGDRFTLTPEAGVTLTDAGRDLSFGWRLVRVGAGTPVGGALDLSFEARRRESANDDIPPEHQVGFRLDARF